MARTTGTDDGRAAFVLTLPCLVSPALLPFADLCYAPAGRPGHRVRVALCRVDDFLDGGGANWVAPGIGAATVEAMRDEIRARADELADAVAALGTGEAAEVAGRLRSVARVRPLAA